MRDENSLRKMPRLDFMVQNIRGTYTTEKMEHFLELAEENNVTMILVNETRYDESRYRPEFVMKLKKDRWGASWRHDPQRPSGSGVGILYRRDLAPYLGQVKYFSGYALSIPLSLRRFGQIMLFTVYASPCQVSSRALIPALKRWLLREIRTAVSNNHMVLVAGDFNTSSSRFHAELTQALLGAGLVDLAEEHGNISPTHGTNRIDFIFGCTILASHTSKYTTIDLRDSFLNFDHKALVLRTSLGDYLDRDLQARIRQAVAEAGRRVVKVSNVSEEGWMRFENAVSRNIQHLLQQKHAHSWIYCISSVEQLEDAWNLFETAITSAAKENLPSKKHGPILSIKPHPSDKYSHAISELRRWKTDRTTEALPSWITQLVRENGGPPTCTGLTKGQYHRRAWHVLSGARLLDRLSRKSKDIHDAVDARCENMTGSLSRAIASVLDRRRPTSIVDRVLVDGKLTHDPSVVRQTIASQVGEWFQADTDLSLNNLDGRWAEAFEPRSDIQPEIWNGIMDAPLLTEIQNVMINSAPDKAPGPSGLTYRLLSRAGTLALKLLQSIFSACLKLKMVPSRWREGLILLIPKTSSGYTGSILSMRPITLLESASKLLMKIIVQRIFTVIKGSNVKIVKGAYHSVLPGTDTMGPISILSAALSQSHMRKQSLWVYFEDKSKAFDSVPHYVLRLALQRLRFPPSFIQFYCDGILNDRNAQVITSYGLSDKLIMHRGIPQGAVESPLMWILFYDVLLTQINRECHGITLKAFCGERFDTSSAIRYLGQVKLAAMCYVDDAVFFAPNRLEMEKLIRIVDEFNTLTRVRANPSKGAIMVIHDATNNPLKIGNHEIPFIEGNDGFRYLGIWVNRKHDGKASMLKAQQTLNQGVNMLKRKIITGKMAVAFLNIVIFPSVLYRTRNFVPPESILIKWDRTARTLVKRKYRLPKCFPSSALYHKDLVGLDSLTELVVQQHVTDLMIMLSDSGCSGIPVRVCLGLIQRELHIPCSPLMLVPDTPVCKAASWFCNLLPMMRRRQITLVDTRCEFDIELDGHHSPIASVVPWRLIDGPTRKQLAKADIWFLSQLHSKETAPSSTSAHQIMRKLNGRKLRQGHEVLARAARLTVEPNNNIAHHITRPQPLPLSSNSLSHLFVGHDISPILCEPITQGTNTNDSVLTYTDGSWKMDTETINSGPSGGGAGVYFPEVGIQYATRVPIGPGSSTRAEIWALILATITCPIGSKLLVRTDSQVAIHESSFALAQVPPSPRRRVRSSCAHEWSLLRYLLKARSVKLILEHVKAHVGEHGNTIADTLANLGRRLCPLIPSLSLLAAIDVPVVLHFDGSPIFSEPRRGLKRIYQYRNHEIFKSRCLQIFNLSQVHGPISSKVVNGGYAPCSLFTTRNLDKNISRRLKFVTGNLPTRSRNHTWWPELYPSPLCPVCDGYSTDDQTHWLYCPESVENMQLEWNNSTDEHFLYPILSRATMEFRLSQPARVELIKVAIKTLWSPATLPALAAGLVNLSMLQPLRATLGKMVDNRKRDPIIIKLLVTLSNYLWSEVWSGHCERVASFPSSLSNSFNQESTQHNTLNSNPPSFHLVNNQIKRWLKGSAPLSIFQ